MDQARKNARSMTVGPQPLVHAALEGRPVSAVCCGRYDFADVSAALRELLAPLGGMQAFVRPGERIALKPNLLFAARPEQAITTHPAVVAAVAVAIREAGATPVVVESPGSGIVHVRPVIERVYRKSGLREVADRYGFELNLDMNWETVSQPDGVVVRRLDCLSPILQADGVINLAKFKTHTFMTFTGATKNLFGVVPGLNKPGYHAKLSDPSRFAGMLLDVAHLVRPRLSIVDGILAMEGMGPGASGTPRRLGLMLAGVDPIAVDVVCCRIAGIDTDAVPVLAEARKRGLWGGRAADTDTLGVPVHDLAVDDFVLPSRRARDVGLTRFPLLDRTLGPVLRAGFTPLPRPKAERCTRCGACVRSCPTDAMSMGEMVAQVDDSRCIRCYCCHELCPSAAIDLEFKGMGWVVHRLGLV
jgi:uncharacterized protein (DUF362 family)/NAD-dependent dihydropyrimidine dehydrogenase PreA subunit